MEFTYENLRKWFGRKGAKGKTGGWVDCNAPDGKGGYKPCGRKKGEKRKYPACRPTPAGCKDKGKGKKWGKKSRKSKKMKKEDLINIVREELNLINALPSQITEKDDACTRKVKARYKVWPSAYASGAVSKCRKVGAANWGNKSKKKKKNEEVELKNPKKADLNKDGKLSSYEKKRGAAIEKNLKEMIYEYLSEIEAEDDTEFTLDLKHLLKKHVTKGGEIEEANIKFTKNDMATLHKKGTLEKGDNTYEYDEIEEDMYEGGCMEEDMYEGGCMEEEANDTDSLEETYIIESEDEIQMIEDALNEEEEEMEEGRKKGKCKPSKGKRFAKRVDGKCRSFGQKGKASDGGDRIRPGTKKAHAYCARSAKIKKCKNPPCANTLSRRKWKCQGSRSVPESIQEIKRFQRLAGIIK